MKRATIINSRMPLIRPAAVVVLAFCATGLFTGCGVKGKPLPPLEPAEIGRGAPTYKRAAEQAKPGIVPASPNMTRPTASPSPERHGP